MQASRQSRTRSGGGDDEGTLAAASSTSGRRYRRQRQLAGLQYAVPPSVVHLLKRSTRQKDVLGPLTVECSKSPRASFRLAFDMMTVDPSTGSLNLDVKVRDVVAHNDMNLRIVAAVTWRKRRAGAPDVASETTDESAWPAAEPPVRVTLDGEGHVGSFCLHTLVSLTVHLAVYAEGDCTLATMFGGLNALRLQDTLADVQLRVDGEEAFPAHRAVLAANSPVFRTMFTSGLKEAQEGVVKISGTTATAFGLFLEFLYTASVVDWKGCEVELLELADRYLVTPLEAACEERLLEMDWSTALRILEKADKPIVYGDLRKRAVRVCVKHWTAMSETQEWINFQGSFPVLADAICSAHELYSEKL